MSHSGKTRYAPHSRSVSPSPYTYSRSVSRSLSRSRSRSRSRDSIDAENPGNNLYVTGLSSRVTERELEKHFETEGKVVDVHLVVDPWTNESRGFGFVTMSRIKEADRCIKYLDRSVLEDRVITVEKAKRRRGRTPTPGRYLGMQTRGGRCHSTSYSSDRSSSPYYRRRAYSPHFRRYRSRSRSPYDRFSRSPSYTRRRRSYSRDSRDYSSERSVSPYYHRRYACSISRSRSRSISPRTRYGRRFPSRSISPRRSHRRGYSRSYSPRSRGYSRSYSRSYSPRDRRSRRSHSRSYSPRVQRWPSKSSSYSRSSRPSKRRSRESYSHSRSNSPTISSR